MGGFGSFAEVSSARRVGDNRRYGGQAVQKGKEGYEIRRLDKPHRSLPTALRHCPEETRFSLAWLSCRQQTDKQENL